MASTQPATQKPNFDDFLVKYWEKSAVKHFTEKTYFAYFCEFVSNLFSKIAS